MKIAVISDTHLGYKFDSEIGDDSFDNLIEVVSKISDCDFILFCGDVFDSKIPKPEIMAKAMKIFLDLKNIKSDIKIVEYTNILDNTPIRYYNNNNNSIPIVSIYGTHERRGKDLINPVEMLHEIGFLYCLDKSRIVFEKNGEKVCIVGFSSVSDMYAKKDIKDFNQKGVDGCYNIFVMHQSIEGYVYSDEHLPILSVNDLPEGYDVIFNGHIHEYLQKKVDSKYIIFPGSTIVTQIKKENDKEYKNKVGFLKFDTKTNYVEYIELKKNRKIYYDLINVDEIKDLKEYIIELISKKIKFESSIIKKPIYKIVLIGYLEKYDNSFNFEDIVNRYKDKIILKIDNKIVSKKQKESFDNITKMRQNSISIDKRAENILKERAKKAVLKLDIDSIMDSLIQGNVDETYKIIYSNNK
jgi:DNA repair exonuclease SbcCD nuclease subunit